MKDVGKHYTHNKNIRHWCTVDTVFINLCGDFITGYIHEELVEDNYLSPTEATILAKELILGGLRHLEDYGDFKKLLLFVTMVIMVGQQK